MVYLAHIRAAFALSNGSYGSPRMHRGRIDDGHKIGRRRTARLMRENKLIARSRRRFKRTTDSGHAWPLAPNPIDQDAAAERPDRQMERGHLLYPDGGRLAVSCGGHRPLLPAGGRPAWFARKSLPGDSWASSDRLKRDQAVEALRRALVARNPPPRLVHHSDRGSQYCSVDYQSLLRKRDVLISLSAIACNRLPATHERKGELLRQRHGGNLLQDHQVGAHMAGRMADLQAGRKRHRKIRRRVLQSRQAALIAWLREPCRL